MHDRKEVNMCANRSISEINPIEDSAPINFAIEVMRDPNLDPNTKALWCYAAAAGREVTTMELCEALGMHRETVYLKTRALVDEGVLSSRRIGRKNGQWLFTALAPAGGGCDAA